MNNIWSPWRAEYILGSKGHGCLFCDAPKSDDSLIIKKAEHCFAMMNRFPYTTGHSLVAPMRHTGDITDLNHDEASCMTGLIKEIVMAIKETMKPEGFNIGINMGAAAGAGIAEHIHVHIVPRWVGDTNFLPVMSDVHLISEHIESTLAKIKGALA